MFDEEHNHPLHPGMHKRNWLRHTAMVPKGFIRYHVLEALNEKPMSGSEMMEQIEKHTVVFGSPVQVQSTLYCLGYKITGTLRNCQQKTD